MAEFNLCLASAHAAGTVVMTRNKIMMRFKDRTTILSLCLSMIFSENRCPLFRIML
jgi:hypothetical protein